MCAIDQLLPHKNVCFVGMEIFCPVYHFFMAISITIIPSQDAREEIEIKYWPVYPIDPFLLVEDIRQKKVEDDASNLSK